MKQGQKNWEYSHTEHAWPIVNVFSPKSKLLARNSVLKQKLARFQQVECNNHLRGGIINLSNEKDHTWLIAARNLGYKYAVFWFDGCWPVDEEYNNAILDEIDRFNLDDPDWVIAGQIRQMKNLYPHLEPSIVIVNIEKWTELGEPHPFAEINNIKTFDKIGTDWEDSFYKVSFDDHQKEHGHWDNVDVNEMREQYTRQLGDGIFYSWLSWSIDKFQSVWGISDTLMDTITYVKPQVNPSDLENAITGKEYRQHDISYSANKMVTFMHEPSSPIYFVNTEPSQPEIAEEIVDTDFEQYVGATAGFKLLYYAYKYGVNPGFTNFIWYDFDPASCAFKRETLKEWDGTNYPAWVEDWCKRNPESNQLLKDMTYERWPMVIDSFGGANSFQDFWTQISFSDHTVLEVDLINNHDTLFEKIKNKRTFMWTSNIYSYIIPTLLAKPFQLEKSFISLVEKLQATHNDSWFSGTDVMDNDIVCPASAILSATENDSIGYEQ